MANSRSIRRRVRERKGSVTVRMDPHLLAYFNDKAASGMGSRTHMMEDSMRRGELYDKITQAVATALVNTPELYEKYAPADGKADYWPSDGTRMNRMDAAIANMVSDIVARQCDDVSGLSQCCGKIPASAILPS